METAAQPSERGPDAGRDAVQGLLVGAGWIAVVTLLGRTAYWMPYWVSTYWLCGAALAVAVGGRRSFPRAMFWAVILGYPLVYRTGLQTEFHLAPVLLAAFAATRSGKVRPAVAAVATAASTVALLIPGGPAVTTQLRVHRLIWNPDLDPSYTVSLACLGIAAAALGTVVRRLEQTTADLAARNAELRRLQEVRTEQAVLAERTRIARELHDVVAHHVSAIVVRAQAATRVADRRPEAPLEATEWIAGAGREALTSMRGMVAVLRDTTAGSPLAPAAGLADVARAADRVRQAGVAVTLTMPPPDREYPAEVTLAVARIVEEALTNVLLHSAATTVQVIVEEVGTALVVSVDDPGPARPGTGESRTSAPSARALKTGGTPGDGKPDDGGRDDGRPDDGRPDDSGRGGNGLTNMRERARASGGTLTAGPTPRHGWSVRAVLPLTRTDEEVAP